MNKLCLGLDLLAADPLPRSVEGALRRHLSLSEGKSRREEKESDTNEWVQEKSSLSLVVQAGRMIMETALGLSPAPRQHPLVKSSPPEKGAEVSS